MMGQDQQGAGDGVTSQSRLLRMGLRSNTTACCFVAAWNRQPFLLFLYHRLFVVSLLQQTSILRV